MIIKIVVAVALLSTAVAEIKPVYDITQLVNFGDSFGKALGCGSPQSTEFSFGTYLHDEGLTDALNVLSNSWQFQVQTSCIDSRAKYFRVFGTDENYDKIISQGADRVIQSLKNTAFLNSKDLIIDWKYNYQNRNSSDIENSVKFLKAFINQFRGRAYIKLPASSLCVISKSAGGLKSFGVFKGFIVEMYGKGSDYQNFDSIFTKTEYAHEQGDYSVACPKNPSFKKLQELLGDSPFFIAKTLHQHIKGHVWNFQELLNQAVQQGLKIDRVFYDDYPQNMIRL